MFDFHIEMRKFTDGDEQSYIHTCHDYAPELSAWLLSQ